MQNRISKSFRTAGDAEVIAIGHRVTNKMDKNAYFPNPPQALADAQKLLPDLQTALTNAGGRDKEMTSIKNDKKAAMVALLLLLADYVTEISNGDKSILLSSGFDLVRSKGERTLPPVTGFQVSIDKPGEATTLVKRVIGARVYIYQYTKDPLTDTSTWTDKIATATSYTFTDLPSGVKHWFRVVVVGMNGQMEYSPPVSRIIQ